MGGPWKRHPNFYYHCICIHNYPLISIYMCICMYAYMYVCVCCVCRHMCVCVCVCACVCVCIIEKSRYVLEITKCLNDI